MTKRVLHPFADDYLQRLRYAGRHLPPDRLTDLLLEIEAHLSEAIPPGVSDDQALEVLERLGPPGDIIDAEQPADQPPTDRRGPREWAAVILLPLGGFAFGVGWLAGLILLWSSRLWTTRDKLIGTLIIPGGIATGLFVFLVLDVALAGTSGAQPPLAPAPVRCRQFATGATHCHPAPGGTSTATTVLYIALAAVLLLGPIVSAVYLARRAGKNSPSIATAAL